MLIAYILSKSRFLRLKFVSSKKTDTFKKGRFEYNINPKCEYLKKLFGVKAFFWSMYFEGNPNPIEFDQSKNNIVTSDVSLDEIAYILHRMLKSTIEIIICILCIVNLIGIIYIISKLVA